MLWCFQVLCVFCILSWLIICRPSLQAEVLYSIWLYCFYSPAWLVERRFFPQLSAEKKHSNVPSNLEHVNEYFIITCKLKTQQLPDLHYASVARLAVIGCSFPVSPPCGNSLPIRPATPYSSCRGDSLPPRAFSAASSVVTMATAAWPWQCCYYYRLDLDSSQHPRQAHKWHTWGKWPASCRLLAVKKLWVSGHLGLLLLMDQWTHWTWLALCCQCL